MGIAAEMREMFYFGKGFVEVGKEGASYVSIIKHSFGGESGGQDAEMVLNNLLHAQGRAAHEISGVGKLRRWATARAYSFQTSLGASCT
jgi:hypothetical protein